VTAIRETRRLRHLVRDLRDEGPVAWLLMLGAFVWALTFALWMVGK
jgi:hypothetical protein